MKNLKIRLITVCIILVSSNTLAVTGASVSKPIPHEIRLVPIKTVENKVVSGEIAQSQVRYLAPEEFVAMLAWQQDQGMAATKNSRGILKIVDPGAASDLLLATAGICWAGFGAMVAGGKIWWCTVGRQVKK